MYVSAIGNKDIYIVYPQWNVIPLVVYASDVCIMSLNALRITCPRLIPYPEPVYTGWSSVHWNNTGMPFVDPVYTGIPLGHPANTCRVHWNTTGKLSWNSPTLECHWRNLVESVPHWDATGETLIFCSLHWNTTGGTVTAHTRLDTHS